VLTLRGHQRANLSDTCLNYTILTKTLTRSRFHPYSCHRSSNLPQQQVDEVLLSASKLLPTPTSEIFGDYPLRVLIAPSGFKENLDPEYVADAIEAGCRKFLDERSVITKKLPLHDGGEGFARALVVAHGGNVRSKTVTGPVGRFLISTPNNLPSPQIHIGVDFHCSQNGSGTYKYIEELSSPRAASAKRHRRKGQALET
jgi:hypothetical protein